MSDHTTHSSDLLNIPSRKKILAKLLNVNDPNTDNDILPAATPEEETPQLPKEKPKMFKIDPNNDILSRVQSFLPQMQTANEQLKQQDPSKLDIENVQEDEDQYIEMNLGLGVFEQKKKKNENRSSESDDEGEEEEESESDENDDDNIVIPSTASGSSNNEKPNIQLLSDSKMDEDK
ncbi:hypothetical protein BDA99DRAFT_234746 [Phascolomyces articulosus]|uniref:Uncharacterized protein n=1 Tax=Phascolomyces articulosus TaxID=60185 RepID=A0AAD5KQZ5_9FUNG|nr:hypothetical protein BDA99DRAFT_234746 [Phascolomyces articulosus]